MRFRSVGLGVALRAHVPNNWVLRALVILIMVQVYYVLGPKGNDASPGTMAHVAT